MTILKKIQDIICFGLLLNEIRYLFISIGIEISPFYWTLEDINDPKVLEPKHNSTGYMSEFFGPAEMKQIAKLAKNHPEDMLLSRLKEGKLCYGLKYNGQIASFCWFDLDECNYKGHRHPLAKDEAYIFGGYTMKHFRGINLAPSLRYNSYNVLKKMGKTRLFSVTQMTNTPAIKFKRKLNATFLWMGVYVNVFNKISRTFIIRSFDL